MDTMHSYKVRLEDCPECGEKKALEKMLNNFTTINKNYIDDKEVGSVVKEKIEDFRNDLKQEKKRLSRQEYADE